MSVETEVKVAGRPERLAALLEAADARRVGPRTFEDDVVLDDGEGRLQATDRLLRLRRLRRRRREPPAGERLDSDTAAAAGHPGEGRDDDEPRAVLTYKGPATVEEGLKVRDERETPVQDPDATLAILAGLGYRPVVRYQKFRTAYDLGDVRVTLDETPAGCFLELEGEAARVHGVAAWLGFERADYEARDYLQIWRDAGNRGDMVFEDA